jgi:hypothetical protein
MASGPFVLLLPTSSFSPSSAYFLSISSMPLLKKFFIIVVLGVHCDLYKSSYNISNIHIYSKNIYHAFSNA